MQNDRDLETIPVGALGLINLNGCEALGQKINNYIVDWRNERENEHKTTLAFAGYQRDNYIVKAAVPRFGSGEAKGVINESVRGYDLYLWLTYVITALLTIFVARQIICHLMTTIRILRE